LIGQISKRISGDKTKTLTKEEFLVWLLSILEEKHPSFRINNSYTIAVEVEVKDDLIFEVRVVAPRMEWVDRDTGQVEVYSIDKGIRETWGLNLELNLNLKKIM
jgi:hypothetical protein